MTESWNPERLRPGDLVDIEGEEAGAWNVRVVAAVGGVVVVEGPDGRLLSVNVSLVSLVRRSGEG